ncbi:hypothetical protein [Agrococcus sp. DT81.2]|uniref:hypothetical protein n=1 Tax=Agrococcus sp. DT81.2 TaxID=3393414 RepID=UPI003CE51595
MALVTGNYVTISGAPVPAGAQPRVQIHPSTSATTLTGSAISQEPQTVTPDATTGAFTFDVIPTTDVLQRGFHYIITGYYLTPTGYGSTGHTRHDAFTVKVFVPADGGSIGDIAVVDTAWGLAWQGPTPPASTMLWLYTEPTFDPDSGAPLPVYTAPDGTTVEHGELVEWSA